MKFDIGDLFKFDRYDVVEIILLVGAYYLFIDVGGLRLGAGMMLYSCAKQMRRLKEHKIVENKNSKEKG